MRILYLTDSSEIHGAEANLLDLLANLDLEQHETFVGLPAAGRLTYQLVGTPTRIALMPFPEPDPERGFGMRDWFLAMRTAASLADYICKQKIDLVHSMTTAAHLVGGLAAKRTRVPAIWHARRMRPLNRLRKLLVDTASRIIAPWDCVCDALVEQGVPADAIVRINDGVDPHSVVPHTGYVLAEREALPKGTFVFANVSYGKDWKGDLNFLVAVEGFEGSPPAPQIWWIGQEEVRTKYGATVGVSLGVRSDMRDVYHAVNCIVIPTTHEQSGRIALEAMCAGRPIIASDVGAHREALRGAGVLVPPDDSEALERAMLKLLNNPELKGKLRDAGRRRAATEFGIRKHVEQVTDLYQSLLTPR